jgi:hypothetical protein
LRHKAFEQLSGTRAPRHKLRDPGNHTGQQLVDDLHRVQARLLPRGIPQERFFGFSSFAARYGGRSFIERVLAAATPLRTDIEDLAL